MVLRGFPWPSILNRDIDTRDYDNKVERMYKYLECKNRWN